MAAEETLGTFFGVSLLINNTAPNVQAFKAQTERLVARTKALSAPLAALRRKKEALPETLAAVTTVTALLKDYYRVISDLADEAKFHAAALKGPQGFPNRFPELNARLFEAAHALVAATAAEHAQDAEVPALTQDEVTALFDVAAANADAQRDDDEFAALSAAAREKQAVMDDQRKLAEEAAMSSYDKIRAAVNQLAPVLQDQLITQGAAARRRLDGAKPWGIPPPPPNFFPGQADAVVTLTEQLQPPPMGQLPRLLAVVGPEGSGKATLAQQVTQVAHTRFPAGGWILDATSAPSLLSGLQVIAQDLGLGADLKADELVIAVRVELARPERHGWLLLVERADKAQDVAAVSAIVPKSGGCVLVTSTQPAVMWSSSGWQVVETGVWSAYDAEQYLRYNQPVYAPADPNDAAAEAAAPAALAEALGRLPVALSVAKAHMRLAGWSYETYRKAVMADAAAHGGPIGAAFALALRAVLEAQAANNAQTILQTLELLHPIAIPRPFLEMAYRRIVRNGSIVVLTSATLGGGSAGSGATGDTAALDRTLAALADYALCSVSDTLVRIHPLVLPTLRALAGAPVPSHIGFVVELTAGLLDVRLQPNFGISRAISVQHHAITAWLEAHAADSAELVAAVRAAGFAEQAIEGHNVAARDLLERALALQVRAAGGTDAPELARTLVVLGLVYSAINDVGRAKAMLERALPLLERSNAGSDQLANALVGLADVHGALGSPAQHKELAERALALRQKDVGEEHPDLVPILVSLSQAHNALGDTRRQKELLERALPLVEQHVGKDHGTVAQLLGVLATCYGELASATRKKMALLRDRRNADDQVATLAQVMNGYVMRQRQTIERAVVICQRRYGPEHPAVADWLVDVSDAYVDAADRPKRKELLERALAMQERYHGSSHVALVKTLTRLGGLAVATSDREVPAGRAMIERALGLLEAAQPPGVQPPIPAIVPVLIELEAAYEKSGAVSARRATLERLLPLIRAGGAAQLPSLVHVLSSLGAMLATTAELDTAKAMLEEAVALHDNTAALKEQVDPCRAYVALGDIYYRLNKYDEAAQILERALAYEDANYDPASPVLVATLTNLGSTYMALRAYTKARPLMERALQIDEKKYGPNHANVLQLRASINTIPPHLHPLARITMVKYNCNLCSNAYADQAVAYHCQMCNYDECPQCFENSGSKEKVSVLAKTTSAAEVQPPAAGAQPVEQLQLQEGNGKSEQDKAEKKGGCCTVQ